MSESSPIERLFSAQGRRLSPPQITGLMSAALEQPDLLSLAAGFTDTETLPLQEVLAAVESLHATPGPPEYLQYGTNRGRPLLRSQLAARVTRQDRRQDSLDDASVLITNGSQQMLSLALQTLCDPGDVILVERPTYFVMLELARGLGVEPRSLPYRDDGTLDHPALDRMLADWTESGEIRRLKAVYLVSYFSNPSSHSLPEAEKLALGETFARHNHFPALIEDAAYRDLFFDSPYPARSILALPGLERFPLLYAGTCTKPFATGLKVGFGICPDELWRDRMLYLKGQQDFGTANFNQAILEQVLSSGAYDLCLERLRTHYRGKRDALLETFESLGLASLGWEWQPPGGGLYVWLRGPASLRTGSGTEFQKRALENGVLYVPGDLCYGDRPPGNQVRISFGVLPRKLLAEAAERFVRTAAESTD